MSDYCASRHRTLPHIVKVSGGRSSAMMLLRMLRQKKLKASRKDVVVFNNTSAEHPATYEFVRLLKKECEQEYGIPFFWLEFQTYEDASQGEWRRFPTFRLVQDQPYSKFFHDGYKWRGEVFEEMISFHNYLPDRIKRSCTQELKVATTQAFLLEWLALKKSTAYLGHYMAEKQLTEDELAWQLKYRNGHNVQEYLDRKRCLLQSEYRRRPQQFNDFSAVGVRPLEKLKKNAFASAEAMVSPEDYADGYVSVIGIRGDEPHRVANIKARMAREETAEIIYMPLAEGNVLKADVVKFWDKKEYDLKIPYETNLTNCVYCFMKSHNTLVEISREMKKIDDSMPPELQSVKNTPSDIKWWMDIEKKYQRIRKGKSERTKGGNIKVGFFGVSREDDKKAPSYRRIRLMAKRPPKKKKSIANEELVHAQCSMCGDY